MFVCLFVCLSVALQIFHFRRSNKVLIESPITCIFKNFILFLFCFLKHLNCCFLVKNYIKSSNLLLKFLYVGAPVRTSPASFRISQEIQCFPYAGFSVMKLFLDAKKKIHHYYLFLNCLLQNLFNHRFFLPEFFCHKFCLSKNDYVLKYFYKFFMSLIPLHVMSLLLQRLYVALWGAPLSL